MPQASPLRLSSPGSLKIVGGEEVGHTTAGLGETLLVSPSAWGSYPLHLTHPTPPSTWLASGCSSKGLFFSLPHSLMRQLSAVLQFEPNLCSSEGRGGMLTTVPRAWTSQPLGLVSPQALPSPCKQLLKTSLLSLVCRTQVTLL